MSINFNAQTTINGNVEMFNNGSMKIVGNQFKDNKVNIENLKDFIENNLKNSPHKEEYIEIADILQKSNDESKLKEAVIRLKSMVKELGKSITINGLSTVAVEIIKRVLGI